MSSWWARVVVTGVLSLGLTPGQGTLRLIDPDASTLLVGPVTFRVAVPSGVKLVVYEVDGVEACRSTAPPFSCTWDAGSRLASKIVHAVATMEDGTRVRAVVQTKGLTVTDTSSADRILVPARVTDGDGRFVAGLAAADFTLLDEGQPQEVMVLESGQGAAEVLLALDVSGSMAPLLGELRDVVRHFLNALRPDDKVTLAAFNTGLFVMAGRDTTRAAKDSALDRLRPFGGTAIFDTIIRGVEVLKKQPGRRALIVFTDGQDVASQATLAAARAELQANDVLLYFVAGGQAASDRDLKKRLTDLAIETGGAGYFSDRLSATSEHFQQIARDLGQQYLLAFSPSRPLGDGKWRDISVSTKNRRYNIRARTGYVAARRGQDGR